MTTISPSSHNPLDDILRDLDAHDKTTAIITVESRRYGKAVTIIAGLDDRGDVRDLLRALRQGLATGGSVKDGRIELQGDHRRRAGAILESHGLEVRP